MKAVQKILLFAWVVSAFTACNYKLEKLSAPPGLDGSTSLSTDQLSFSIVMSKVIQPKCLECHSAAGGNPGDVNLESYAQVIANLSDVKADVEDGSMPKNRQALSTTQKQLILDWIAAGAPEVATAKPNPQASPTPPVVTTPTPAPSPASGPQILDYASVKREVLDTACLKCHSVAGGNRGDVNLESYAQVIANLSDVKSDIEDGSMPKRSQLTPEQKSLILDWIAAGAPETATVAAPGPATPAPATPVVPGPAAPPKILLDYASVKREVLDTSCLKCHSAPANRGHVNLESYQEVLKNIADVKSDVEDGSMPKRSQLTPEQKSLILDWIAAGAPEVASTVVPTNAALAQKKCDEQNLTASFVGFMIGEKQPNAQDASHDDQGDPCLVPTEAPLNP